MPQEVANSKFTVPDDDRPVLSGNILKKNRFFMQQERKFDLYANGDLKYFKGIEQKGIMVLTKLSRARKVSKTQFEVVLPDVEKTYQLIQMDLKRCPPKADRYSCVIDDWVDAINFVIALQSQR